ncbi:Aldo/keto reductase [Lactarius hatsudake]|nr:Aldo/keto reductase [Lactarius hatsudake]
MASILPTRRLRVGTAHVSAIGYGAMGISSFYGAAQPDEERFKLLDAAYEAGCTNWDTADAYGDSEELISFQRTGKRSEIFLATKFGAGSPSGKVVDCSPAYVREALNKSLEKLGVDRIMHIGKIEFIGLCECNGETLRRANKVHPISAIQVEYSPFTLDAEDPKIGALQAAGELRITVPEEFGLDSQTSLDEFKESDLRRIILRYSKENFPNVLKVVEEVKQIRGPDIILIPGTCNVKYVNENLCSLNVKPSPEEVQEVRNIAKRADTFLGGRYPAGWLETVYANTPSLRIPVLVGRMYR